MMGIYFKIIDESNSQILSLINKYTIQRSQYFPVFAFSNIYSGINDIEVLKERQRTKVQSAIDSITAPCKVKHNTIDEIMSDTSVTESNKSNAVLWSTFNGDLSLQEVEKYLRTFSNKSDTPYRRILCAYDIKKYDA
jgi:hypothetical protein